MPKSAAGPATQNIAMGGSPKGLHGTQGQQNLHRLFVLVHGTFAGGAAWTLPGSKLRTAIEQGFPSADIKAFAWTGENLEARRRDSASALATWVCDYAQQNAISSAIIVAHSHGGNIAVQAAADPRIKGLLGGVVCLSTPFLAYEISPFAVPDSFVEKLLYAWPMWITVNAQKTFELLFGGWFSGLIATAVGLTVWASLCFPGIALGSAMEARLQKGLLSPKWGGLESLAPVLVLSHKLDEAYWVLKLLNLMTRWGRVLKWVPIVVGIVIATVGMGGESYVLNLYLWIMVRCHSVGPAGFGLCWGVVLCCAWYTSFLLGILFECFWVGAIVSPLHLLRGSEFLATIGRCLRLPLQTQIGFGEAFRQSWLEKLNVSRSPLEYPNVTYRTVTYARSTGLLLHCEIYNDNQVIEKVISFCASSIPKIENSTISPR